MDEAQIRRIAQQVYDQNADQGQASTLRVPNHVHNGVDVKRISQNDIVPGTYASAGLRSNVSETFTIEVFPSIDNIILHGIAADGLGKKAHLNGHAAIGNCFQYGSITPAGNLVQLVGGRYKNIIQSSSNIYFDPGTSETKTFLTGATADVGTDTDSFILYGSFNAGDAVTDVTVDIDTTQDTITSGAAAARVGAAGDISDGSVSNLILVNDGTNDVASMVITEWTETTITFKTVLASPWYVQFYLTMS